MNTANTLDRGPRIGGALDATSGQSLLHAIRDRHLPPPPAAQLLHLDLIDVGHGRVAFDFHPASGFDNGQGAVHGGVLAAVLDFAVGAALLTTVDIGTTVVTANLNVSFIRPVPPDGETLRCVGQVIHRGQRSAHADADLVGPDGRIYARATATCRITAEPPRPHKSATQHPPRTAHVA
jgi:uncharacterized protein (TIGR00369 family)